MACRGALGSSHRTKHLNNIPQARGEFVAAIKRADAGGGAGEDHVAGFQSEGLADFGQQFEGGKQHQAGVAVLFHFLVDLQGHIQVLAHGDAAGIDKAGYRGGAVEGLGPFPGEPFFL